MLPWLVLVPFRLGECVSMLSAQRLACPLATMDLRPSAARLAGWHAGMLLACWLCWLLLAC